MCVCVSVLGVLFSIGVCVCDLLIFLQPASSVSGTWGLAMWDVYINESKRLGAFTETKKQSPNTGARANNTLHK